MNYLNMQINSHVLNPNTCIVILLGGSVLYPMGDGEDSQKNTTKTIEVENLCLDTSSNTSSRDLLQRFRGTSSDSGGKNEENEEIELNLGLSLGGRFGVDKNTSKLVRSSSIAACLPVVRDDNSDVGAPQAPMACTGLVRTSSLPVESEEEWRKRKEMQSLRRMEAKRRRSEKQRNLRSERGGGSLSLEEKREIEGNFGGKLQREKSLSSVRRPMGLSMWAAMGKGKGSCSSSDLESKALQESGELSAASIQSFQEVSNQDTSSSASRPREHTRSDVARNRGREININALEDMPCVFTKGDGPNGRRVDGILYKYGRGEEVRIMCVCHGSFHSPDEFVRHAGGTDVDNPLKHIVVNPNAAPLV